MPQNTIRGKSGQVESDTEAGPSSYPSGGFSISTALGRADNAIVEADDGAWEAVVSQVTSNNILQVAVFSQAAGNEVSDSTDLSGVTFTYHAYRL